MSFHVSEFTCRVTWNPSLGPSVVGLVPDLVKVIGPTKGQGKDQLRRDLFLWVIRQKIIIVTSNQNGQ